MKYSPTFLLLFQCVDKLVKFLSKLCPVSSQFISVQQISKFIYFCHIVVYYNPLLWTQIRHNPPSFNCPLSCYLQYQQIDQTIASISTTSFRPCYQHILHTFHTSPQNITPHKRCSNISVVWAYLTLYMVAGRCGSPLILQSVQWVESSNFVQLSLLPCRDCPFAQRNAYVIIIFKTREK